MKTVIDTNLFLTATCIQEAEIPGYALSPWDHNSHTETGISPRAVRGFILSAIRSGDLAVPSLQLLEIKNTLATQRARGHFSHENEALAQLVEIAASKAKVEFRPLKPLLREQAAAAATAVAMAKARTADSNVDVAWRAKRFLNKNPSIEADTRFEANCERLERAKPPRIWMDWYLCQSAVRFQGKVYSNDHDLSAIADAFQALYQVNPHVHLQTWDEKHSCLSFAQEAEKLLPPKTSQEPWFSSGVAGIKLADSTALAKQLWAQGRDFALSIGFERVTAILGKLHSGQPLTDEEAHLFVDQRPERLRPEILEAAATLASARSDAAEMLATYRLTVIALATPHLPEAPQLGRLIA